MAAWSVSSWTRASYPVSATVRRRSSGETRSGGGGGGGGEGVVHHPRQRRGYRHAPAAYPYLLGTALRISDAAARNATLIALGVVGGAAVVLMVPSPAWLFLRTNRGQLT